MIQYFNFSAQWHGNPREGSKEPASQFARLWVANLPAQQWASFSLGGTQSRGVSASLAQGAASPAAPCYLQTYLWVSDLIISS